MAITTIGGTINSTAVTSNLDYKYGPYSSKQEAYDTLGPNGVDKLAIGLTVGIIEEGRIREYWFRNDISSVDDLVLKSEGPSAYDIAVENGYSGTEEEWLESLKANISIKFVNYDGTAESAFTTGGIGTPYSGTIDGLTAGTDTDESIILLMNNTNGTTSPTKTFMIATQEVTPATSPATYEFIYIGDLQSAMPSNVLTEDDIDNSFAGGSDKVAGADEVKNLNTQLNQIENVVNGGTEENITEYGADTFTSEYIVARGANGVKGTNNGDYLSTEPIEILDSFTKIEVFCLGNGNYFNGVTFYSANTGIQSSYVGEMPKNGITGNGLVTILPSDLESYPNAKYLRATGIKPVDNCYVKIYTEQQVEGLNDKVGSLQESIEGIDNRVTALENVEYPTVVQTKGQSTTNVMSQKAVTDIIDGTDDETIDNYDSSVFVRANVAIARDANGATNNSATDYYSTNAIEIPQQFTKIEVFCLGNNPYYNGVTFYNSSNPLQINYVGEMSRVSEIVYSKNGLVTILPSDLPANAKYFVATGCNLGGSGQNITDCYIKIYTNIHTKGLNDKVSDLEDNVDSFEGIVGIVQSITKASHSIISKSDSMSQGDVLELDIPNTAKKYTIGFSANVDSNWNGRLRIKSNSSLNYAWVEIDNANIYYYYTASENPSSPTRTISHGLTISNFLSLTLQQNDMTYKVQAILCSESGQFIDDVSNVNGFWNMCANVPLRMTCINGSCTNALFTFTLLPCDVWVFGDSYLNYIYNNMSTTTGNQLKNALFDGYGGRGSSVAKLSFEKSIAIGTPKLLVWAMGMNDMDTSSAINADWKSAYDSVSAICDSYGIELVLVTIPTTSSRNNNYKNSFIKSSGRRYVDIAAAVGADGSGSWTTGYLADDDTHPTILGSKVIIGKYLSSVPEMFGK